MKLRPLLFFWCLWFTNFFVRTAFSPLLPLIEDALSLSHGQAGGLFTSMFVGYGLSLLIAGRFASRWGYKRTVLTGFVLIAIGLFFVQAAETYLAIHLVCFLIGTGLGAYLPAILPIITETYEQKDWGKVIGIHDSAASFGFFATPILIAFGLHFLSWKRILLILGMICLLLPLYFWRVAVEPKKQAVQEKGSYAKIFEKRSMWVLALLFVVANASCGGIYAILPLYMVKERAMDFDFVNTLVGISRVGGVFVSIVLGFLADRHGFLRLLKISIFTTGLSTLAIALASSVPFLATVLFVQAMFSVAFFPLAFATISRLTSLSERAMAAGVIICIGVIFGTGLTPLLLGLTADHFSFQAGILGVGIITMASYLLVGFLEET